MLGRRQVLDSLSIEKGYMLILPIKVMDCKRQSFHFSPASVPSSSFEEMPTISWCRMLAFPTSFAVRPWASGLSSAHHKLHLEVSDAKKAARPVETLLRPWAMVVCQEFESCANSDVRSPESAEEEVQAVASNSQRLDSLGWFCTGELCNCPDSDLHSLCYSNHFLSWFCRWFHKLPKYLSTKIILLQKFDFLVWILPT